MTMRGLLRGDTKMYNCKWQGELAGRLVRTLVRFMPSKKRRFKLVGVDSVSPEAFTRWEAAGWGKTGYHFENNNL